MTAHDRGDTAELAGLVTEGRALGVDLDTLSVAELLRLMNEEDAGVHEAVRKELPNIERAVRAVTATFKRGGRMFYVGAGTSGRLGALDAFECPLTFGVEPDLVQAVVARDADVLRGKMDDDEDYPEMGAADLKALNPTNRDIVVGISASGRTPYVLGAIKYAASLGAETIAVVCNPKSPIAEKADIAIAPVVGPEILMGSTRLKAGTAQKMALNMLSTASMVQCGKVYSNLMVDVRPDNHKLRVRSTRIVRLATGCGEQEARRALDAASGKAKVAILSILVDCEADVAESLLDEAEGSLRAALDARRSVDSLRRPSELP